MKTLYSFLSFSLLAVLFSTVSAQLYWSDSFGNYTSGSPLDNNGGWTVQESPTQGYMIQSASPLVYNNLLSDNNYAIGGYNYLSSGIAIPLEEGSLLSTNHLSDATPGSIGYKAGGSNVLWYSQLVRVDENDYLITDFHNRGGDFAWWVTTWNLGIMRNAGSHQWGIIVNNDERQFSNVTTEVGEVTLIVAKLLFEADGITISLYVNPTPGVEPATPTISGKSTAITSICAIQQYLGFGSNKYSLDEMRLGETYADVAPLLTSTKVLKNFEKNPVVYSNDGSIVADLSAINGECSMQIYDIKGQMVKALDVVSTNKVCIPNLKNGLYLVKVTKGEKSFTTKVMI